MKEKCTSDVPLVVNSRENGKSSKGSQKNYIPVQFKVIREEFQFHIEGSNLDLICPQGKLWHAVDGGPGRHSHLKL